MYDLIIKPTQLCNFRCSFCSSSDIAQDNETLSLNTLFNFLKNNDIGRIIINGGDPLMMPPEYYTSILNFLDKNNMSTRLSFTTNLWDYYNNPSKWEKIFKEDRVGVCTSFQYGGQRKLCNNEPLTEEIFIDIMNNFYEHIGYMPMFISVITDENENDVIRTAKLAKSMKTECKINPSMQSGRSHTYYPLYKAYSKYLDIIEEGLSQYEFNSKEIVKLYQNTKTICPYNRNCVNTIRCMSPDGTLHSCGCFNDDYKYNKKNGKKTYELDKYDADTLSKDYKYIHAKCLECDLFALCNSCYKHIHDIKINRDEAEHCSNMQNIKDRLVKILCKQCI